MQGFTSAGLRGLEYGVGVQISFQHVYDYPSILAAVSHAEDRA